MSVDSVIGNCPNARFVFTARIDTNGGVGTLQLRWLQPDGERTERRAWTFPRVKVR